jgi:hypothetical protein
VNFTKERSQNYLNILHGLLLALQIFEVLRIFELISDNFGIRNVF